VFAKAGRAELLKALGRLDEALMAYDAVLAAHPEDAVAKNGRAEVLKALGRLDEALVAYDTALAAHPEDVIAKTGRAEVLKALGRLDDALMAYDSIRMEHSEDLIARNGQAVVLAAMGRWQEALQKLPQAPTARQFDWHAYHIRGMILLRTGNLGGAEAIFEHGVQHDPFAADRDYFRAALAVVRLRRRKLGDVLALLTQVTLPALRVPANVLSTHALELQGETTRAAEAFARIPLQGTPLLLDIREELRRRLGHEPPRYDEDKLIDLEIDLLDQAA
jgi:tetratricopeptide (TPR) repeat protein